MQVLTFTNQKGGVAKTTTAHTVGAYLAQHGSKVLLVDLDAQANLTLAVGLDDSENTTSDVLLNPSCIQKTIKQVKNNLWIIPADLHLSKVSETLTDIGRNYKLQEAFKIIENQFDYAIIDTPPTLSILTINALTVSNKVVIPAQADLFSLKALQDLAETLQGVKTYTNKKLEVAGLLLTRYNPRSILTKDMTERLEKACKMFNTKLFNSKIREAIAIKEAQATHQDIFSYDATTNVAKDYLKFIEELLK